MQEQLQNATREILGQRTRELSQQNTVQMTAIIDPLKETIRDAYGHGQQPRHA